MKGSWRRLGLGISSILPVVAPAQSSFNESPGVVQPPLQTLTGTATIDLIRLQAMGPGVPLRFGAVIPGSERVEHEGRVLQKGVDYQIDYETGVVYLMRAQRAGQSLLVSYLYDKSAQKSAADKQFGGMPTFKFDLLPGGLKILGGFGFTERLADGNVVSSNLYGIQNAFDFSGVKVNGLMLVGDRNKQDARSAFEYQGAPGTTETGSSQAILQNFATKFAGGTVQADYQDISTNFTGFGAVKDAGFNADQLKKERGLQRMGFNLSDLNIGGFKFSNGFRTVKDGDESVDWRSFGLKGGGFTLNWKSQHVDQNFKRFKDLAEGDREQLLKEAGLDREQMSFGYQSKLANLNYSSNQVEDQAGNGIYRRELGLDVMNVRFLTAGDQTIDAGFNRFGSLFEPERGQWGREAGLKRQWLALDTSVLGAQALGLKFSQNILRSPVGEFQALDASMGGKGWSLEHSSREVDAGFGSLGALAEGEMDNHIRAIAGMYDKTANLWRPEERRFFFQSAGIARSLTRFGAQPFKNWNVGFEQLDLQGQNDGAKVDTITINGSKIALKFRRQELGSAFNEIGSLMEFERQRLGTVAGLERSDFGLAMNFGKASKLSYNTMNANVGDAGASRSNFAYSDGSKIDVQVNTREVDTAFNQVNGLVDPERDLLTSLRGFKERDVKGKWNIAPNLTIDVFRFDADSDALDQDRMLQNVALNWKPDKKTSLSYERFDNKSNDPLQVLFAQATEKISLTRDLGKLGALRYFKESVEFDGTQTNAPDSNREYMSYETKLTKTTSVKTEQQRTRFDNGDKEDISANTISTDLSKRAGVSVTDVRIDRGGDERDERKRNYGFWVDLGRGLKLSYGYNRAMVGANGTFNGTWALSPGTLGFLQVNNATYGENRWDGIHTQAFSNLQLSSSKPFNFGMFRDLKVSYSQDTAADYERFMKEGKQTSVSGRLFGATFGLDYRSQVAPDGFHAIDRGVSLSTGPDKGQALSANLSVKARQMSNGDEVMIRNVQLVGRPTKRLTVSNELLTNPEIPRGDVILGSTTDPWRVNRWKLDYKESANTTLGGTWEERRNDLTLDFARTTGLNLTLFQKSGSPLSLFYGIEEVDGRIKRRTDRYFLRFDQRPGANQFLSFYLGNVSYEHSLPDGENRSNWSIRMDYRLRF